MSPRELEKLLKKNGWKFHRHGKGSHREYHHGEMDTYITIPWHQSKEIHPGLLKRILKDAGLKK